MRKMNRLSIPRDLLVSPQRELRTTMPLIYRVSIVDNYIDMEEKEEDTTNGNDVWYETEEVSYNLSRPPGGAPILSKSEAVAAGEFRAIAAHKQFRTHIERDDITIHELHSLLDAFQSRRALDMTIELRRFGDEEDDIAAGYNREQHPPDEIPPRVTVAMLRFDARITHLFASAAGSYELNFQIIGGTWQNVFSAARNFNVPKPRPARRPKSGSKRR
jgi:hypothetical protein